MCCVKDKHLLTFICPEDKDIDTDIHKGINIHSSHGGVCTTFLFL